MQVMEIKRKLNVFAFRYGRRIVWGIGTVAVAALLGLLVSYILPCTIPYSFVARGACAVAPIVFPRSLPKSGTGSFVLSYDSTLRVAGMTVYANGLCVAPGQSPRANARYVIALALSHLSPIKRKIVIQTAGYTRVSAVAARRPLTLVDSLDFQLSQPDNTFTYVISSNGRQDTCLDHVHDLICPLDKLSLHYGQGYRAQLSRTFKFHDAQQVAQTTFQTISATIITSASVSDGSIVYDRPQQLTFQVDKPLASLGAVTLSVQNSNGTEQPVAASATFNGNTITLSIAQPLPRKTGMQLAISSVRARDGSGLAGPYTISFYVSGGPRVTGTTLATYNVTTGPISLSFDQSLDPAQPISPVTLQANGLAIPTSMAIVGNKVVITPQAAYPVCAHLTLNVGSGMLNTYGISGDSAYTHAARVQCYTTFKIGTSVRGRAITAYKIGSGSTQLFFVGTMHGTEQNAGTLLNAWLNELETNVDSIPSGRTIVIVPSVNPDGAAAGTRVNADTIDINRNFPASSWRSTVTEPEGNTGAYGGPSPLSEPESQALANYMEAERPRITVDYHSHAGIVQGNDAGDADTLALRYALASGYSEISSSDTGSEFDYSTTGSFEDWTNQTLGLPEFLVELSSPTNNEFSWNRPAMWDLVKGPLP
jgi:murein peptide amidase A